MTHGNDNILWSYVFLPILTFGLVMPKERRQVDTPDWEGIACGRVECKDFE